MEGAEYIPKTSARSARSAVKRSVFSLLEHRFALAAHGTTVRTEMLAGLTTFLTMAYIIFVQPAVLSAAGMDFGAVLTATCLATAFATVLMALLANYPIAVAPAMGHNFFFAYTRRPRDARAVARGARRRGDRRRRVHPDGGHRLARAPDHGDSRLASSTPSASASAC